MDLRGAKPPGIPQTPWRLLEHLRIPQRDILEFTRNPRRRVVSGFGYPSVFRFTRAA